MKDELFADEADEDDMKDRKKRELVSVINKKGDEYDEKLLEMIMVEDIMEEIKKSE